MKIQKCTINGCTRDQNSRGWCKLHYDRWRREGDAEWMPESKEEKFWSKVAKGDGCWEWQGTISWGGYGMVHTDRRSVIAHRRAWEMQNGLIPDGMQVDHTCWNRACVNPDHLRLALASQNSAYRSTLSNHNKSGHRGVFWRKTTGRWMAQVRKGGKYYTKQFLPDELELAGEWAKGKRQELFGEFAGVAK